MSMFRRLTNMFKMGSGKMIAIIDYDAGNIKSVEKAMAFLGEDACITRDRDVILSSERVISVSYTHLTLPTSNHV